jgi:hypothetical protein
MKLIMTSSRAFQKERGYILRLKIRNMRRRMQRARRYPPTQPCQYLLGLECLACFYF